MGGMELVCALHENFLENRKVAKKSESRVILCQTLDFCVNVNGYNLLTAMGLANKNVKNSMSVLPSQTFQKENWGHYLVLPSTPSNTVSVN